MDGKDIIVVLDSSDEEDGTTPGVARGPKFINSRIAKVFGGKMYLGTITKYVSSAESRDSHAFWNCIYDDGDEEGLSFRELAEAIRLYELHAYELEEEEEEEVTTSSDHLKNLLATKQVELDLCWERETANN